MDDSDFSAIGASSDEGRLSRQALKQAREEEDALADGKKAVQKEIHGIAIWVLRVGAFLILVLVFVRFLHIAGPDSVRWLSDSDIQGIDKMLFSSAFGGLVLSYIKEVMTPIKNG